MGYDANAAQERTHILLGDEGLKFLAGCHIAVVGLGGVGGAAAEAIARAGVGRITLVDHDTIGISNMNRQLACLESTLGQAKAEAMPRRRARPWSRFLLLACLMSAPPTVTFPDARRF